MASTLHHGDCLDVLPTLGPVASIVTDPPAGISFMGATWDGDRGGRDAWVAWLAARLKAAAALLPPGGAALVWALPRTSHWTALAIEEAGLRIDDRLSHIFGQGFPKHKSKLKPAVEDWWLARKPGGAGWLNIEGARVMPSSAAAPVASLDTLRRDARRIAALLRAYSNDGTTRLRGAVDRDGIAPEGGEYAHQLIRLFPNGALCGGNWSEAPSFQGDCPSCRHFYDAQLRCALEAVQASAPSLADALDGIGSALSELERNRYCQCSDHLSNCDAALHISALLNSILGHIDASHNTIIPYSANRRNYVPNGKNAVYGSGMGGGGDKNPLITAGRYPPHLLLSHAADCAPGACVEDCPVAVLGAQSGHADSRPGATNHEEGHTHTYGWAKGGIYKKGAIHKDTGTAARFFPQFWPHGDAPPFLYAAKASRRERNAGCEGLEERHAPKGNHIGRDLSNPKNHLGGLQGSQQSNHHPTVKSQALMRWLVRLVTPPGGVVLDPFMGSGSTGVAALAEGFGFVGVEASAEYLEIARARIAHAAGPLFAEEAA